MPSSDFEIEFNNEGEWSLALVAESNDDNNKVLIYWNGHTFVNTDGYVARGEENGQFRTKA